MADRWQTTLNDVRRRARKWIAVRGLAWLAVVLIGLIAAAALADWTLHLDNPWTRVALALLIVVGGIIAAWQGLLRPLRVPLSDVTLARLIERHRPELADELSTAAQLRESPRADDVVSADLREAVITRAEERLWESPPDGVFDLRPMWTALTALGLIGVGAAGMWAWRPLETGIALERLVFPFAGTVWPRTTRLTLLTDRLQPAGSPPFITSAGQTLQLYVEDTLDEPPEDLRLWIRLNDGTLREQSLRTTLLRDREGRGHEVGVLRLTPHAGALQFRVTGGDDDSMAWHTVEVVPAPAWEQLAITVTPPEYAGQPARTLESAGLIEGLVGSRVTLAGRANKPLTRALLRRDRQPPLPFTQARDGRMLATEFVLEEPGRMAYWFDLTDRDGLSLPDPTRYELRGIADREPIATIEQPDMDLTVTPDARVVLEVSGRDDVGLDRLRLVYRAGDREPAALPMFTADVPVLEQAARLNWELQALGLTPGTQVEFFAEAIDRCDRAAAPDQVGGQVGRSRRRRLSVISPETKRQELAARQSGILGTLDALRERQARTAERVAQLLIQQERTGALRTQDLDLLKAVELEQRQLAEQLTDAPSSARENVEAIRRELAANRLDDPEATGRLDQLAESLGTLGDDWLPRAEQALARARKSSVTTLAAGGDPQADPESRPDESAEGAPAAGDVTGQSSAAGWLREAGEAQAAVQDVLQQLTSDLSGWRRRFELSSSLDSLIADQTSVRQETQDVGRSTLMRRLADLTPQQQADLERLADRQRRLAERLTQLDAPTAVRPTSEGDPAETAPGTNVAALPIAPPEVVAQMHDAAESLRRNEVPQAVAAQERALQALRDSRETLSESGNEDPQELVESLQKAAERIETLRQQQESLIREAAASLSPSADDQREERLERLRKEQRELADESDAIGRQLRGPEPAAARSAARAARQMRDAQDALTRQDPDSVDVHQQQAAQELAQAAAEVARARQTAEQRAAQERLEGLIAELTDWVERQSALTDATSALHDEYTARTRWSRPLRKVLQELMQGQTALAAEVRESLAEVGDDAVLTATLEGAAAWMDDARQQLHDEETGAGTQLAQRSARERLAAILEVLTRQTTASLAAPESPDDPQSRQPDSPGLPPVTQLHLLRQWQAQVNQQTADLLALARTTAGSEPAPPDGRPRADETDARAALEIPQRLSALAAQQQQITELTRQVFEGLASSTDLAPHAEEP